MPAPMPPLEHRITTANAREMAAKSNAARRARVAEAAARALAEKERELAARVEAAQRNAAADYVTRRLASVRAQLDTLDDLIAAEMASGKPDAQRLDRYASAQARLATQEQQLSGRPLPGSRRPGKDRSRLAGASGGTEVEPLD